MNRLALPILAIWTLVCLGLAGFGSCANPNVHPDAGTVGGSSSAPVTATGASAPTPATGGALSTGGLSATGGSAPAPVAGLLCSDAMRTSKVAPRQLLGWVPSLGARMGEPLKGAAAVNVSRPVFWDVNDLANLVQDYGSCTGEGLIQLLSALPRTRHAKQADAMLAYNTAIAPQHCPPDDPGSTLDAIMTAGRKLGWVKDVQVLYSLADIRAALRSGPIEFGGYWTTGDDAPDRCGLTHYVGDRPGRSCLRVRR